MMEEHELGGKLLAGVSRSFYLTLKALPEGMREPLSLGYLLARASDTLADTLEVPNETRLELLNVFAEAVLKETGAEAARANLKALIDARFVECQKDENERLLLTRLDEAFVALDQSKSAHQQLIRAVLIPILKGQTQDVSLFSPKEGIASFERAEQLEEYTYLVAGCVGEFWTQLGLLEYAENFSTQSDPAVLLAQGVNFGKGLQLINILRDVGKDAKLGRCYFSMEELAQAGLKLEQVQANPASLRTVAQPWIERAELHLQDALSYVESLQQPRVRLASALPLLLGLKTLKMIRESSDQAWVAGVKVTRTDVAKVLLDAGFANLKVGGYRKWAEKLARS